MFYYGTLALTIVFGTLYHLAQKATPAQINPLVSLAVTYAVALAGTLALYPFYPHQDTLAANIRQLNWASVLLGLSIIGLELGFLLAYRAGWNISLAGLVSNVTIALLLLPIGLLLYRETLSTAQAAGIALCLAGLFLINYKG